MSTSRTFVSPDLADLIRRIAGGEPAPDGPSLVRFTAVGSQEGGCSPSYAV